MSDENRKPSDNRSEKLTESSSLLCNDAARRNSKDIIPQKVRKDKLQKNITSSTTVCGGLTVTPIASLKSLGGLKGLGGKGNLCRKAIEALGVNENEGFVDIPTNDSCVIINKALPLDVSQQPTGDSCPLVADKKGKSKERICLPPVRSKKSKDSTTTTAPDANKCDPCGSEEPTVKWKKSKDSAAVVKCDPCDTIEEEKILACKEASMMGVKRPKSKCKVVSCEPSGSNALLCQGTPSETLKRKSRFKDVKSKLEPVPKTSCDFNHFEAAIFLKEGENNDKFKMHPKKDKNVAVFIILNHFYFKMLIFVAALGLLFITLFEPPSVIKKSPHYVTQILGGIEIVFLLIIVSELILKLKWLGAKLYCKHARTVFKTVVVVVMIIRVVTVIFKLVPEMRPERLFRPLFLLDTYYCRIVRRTVRQLLQSLPRVLEMIGLLVFFVLIFSILGFYLFNSVPHDTFFTNFQTSFISMFVLLTTANFPDLMLPAFKINKWCVLFYIAFICLEIYTLVNLLLAVIYNEFYRFEREKFLRLLIHRRNACKQAFKMLVTNESFHATSSSSKHSTADSDRTLSVDVGGKTYDLSENDNDDVYTDGDDDLNLFVDSYGNESTCNLFEERMSCLNFSGFMKYFRPKMGRRNVYLCFKSLNVSKEGKLTLQEFTQFYSTVNITWSVKSPKPYWFSNCPSPCKQICSLNSRIVKSKVFSVFIYIVISVNFLVILLDTVRLSLIAHKSKDELDSWHGWLKNDHLFTILSFAFVIIYVIEALMKLSGLGISKYFSSGWNIFDFAVTFIAFVGGVMQMVDKSFIYFVVVRPLRILRLTKLMKSFREIFYAIILLIPRICSLAVSILLLYYSWAIIGMTIFGSHTKDLINCCKHTSVEPFYKVNNATGEDGFYYLCSFENILVSGVTLFALTVVNNWWIIMEAYANVVSEFTRIYFMIFYLTTMVLMAVIVGYVVEAFSFRYKMRLDADKKREALKKELAEKKRILKANKSSLEAVERIEEVEEALKEARPKVEAIERRIMVLSQDELDMIGDVSQCLSGKWIRQDSTSNQTDVICSSSQEVVLKRGDVMFKGWRWRTKMDFSLMLFETEAMEALAEAEESFLMINTPQLQQPCGPETRNNNNNNNNNNKNNNFSINNTNDILLRSRRRNGFELERYYRMYDDSHYRPIPSGIDNRLGMEHNTQLGIEKRLEMKHNTQFGIENRFGMEHNTPFGIENRLGMEHNTTLGIENWFGMEHNTPSGIENRLEMEHNTTLGIENQGHTISIDD